MIFCPLESGGGKISFGKRAPVMADPIQNYDFFEAKYGNTYEAVLFSLPEEPVFSLNEAKIYMQLRKKPGENVVAEFSTENGKFQITGNYTFELVTQVIEVVPDTYYYDILVVFAGGRRETYIGGRWTIHPTITRKKP